MTEVAPGRPKLVFFQWDHAPNAGSAGYLVLHMQHHVKCLAVHFDVVVVNHDCDYAEICDRHEPDLALFEAGYRSHGSRRIDIRNTSANPGVPKLGLHNADPWCDRRAGFLSDMDRWGIETFFSIGTLLPAYAPEISDSTFVWPNFIDPDTYRDYGQHKTIPVTLTGQVYGLYPWRQRVFPLLRDRYPCLVSPQHAYESRAAARLLSGEAYARALNASLVVPTCGTAGGEVVRKHFEIPAAKSCLVTERSAALEAAGFVDMENCVFADAHDVTDRLDALFADRERLQEITEAGHILVHTRHTLRQRPQIHQWFTLQRGLPADEKIIQLGPFGDLVRARRSEARASAHVAAAGLDRALLRQGDFYLGLGRLEDARHAYAASLDIVSYLPEAKFGLALCALQEGDAGRAAGFLESLIEVTTADYGAVDPDPVEWATYLLALVCGGRLDEARRLRNHYPRLAHREIERIGSVIDRLDGPRTPRAAARRSDEDRKSIHALPERSDAEWLAWVLDILERCHQDELAAELRGAASAGSAPPQSRPARRRVAGGRAALYARLDRALLALHLAEVKPNVPPTPRFRYVHRLARNIARSLLGRQWRALRSTLADLRGETRRLGRGWAGRRAMTGRATASQKPVSLDSPR